MLIPRRVKHRKQHHPTRRGAASGGTRVTFGEYGIMAVEGLAFGVLGPIMATVTYETVPEELRSRVLGATTAAVQLVTPLGGLAAGLFVDAAGLPGALLTVGGVYLLATLCPVIFPAWRQMDSSGSSLGRTEGVLPRSSQAEGM